MVAEGRQNRNLPCVANPLKLIMLRCSSTAGVLCVAERVITRGFPDPAMRYFVKIYPDEPKFKGRRRAHGGTSAGAFHY
jgi:hypothetical protein